MDEDEAWRTKTGPELFRELKRLISTAAVEDYVDIGSGTWKDEVMKVDIEILIGHRAIAGAPEPPPLSEVEVDLSRALPLQVAQGGIGCVRPVMTASQYLAGIRPAMLNNVRLVGAAAAQAEWCAAVAAAGARHAASAAVSASSAATAPGRPPAAPGAAAVPAAAGRTGPVKVMPTIAATNVPAGVPAAGTTPTAAKPAEPSGAPAGTATPLATGATADLRQIALFISKWHLEPTRTKVMLARMPPVRRRYVMQNFTYTPVTGVSPVAKLEEFIQECDRTSVWLQVAASAGAAAAAKRPASPPAANGEGAKRHCAQAPANLGGAAMQRG